MARLRFNTRIGRYNLSFSNSRGYVTFPYYPDSLMGEGRGRGEVRRADSPRPQTVSFLYPVLAPETASVVLNLCQPDSPGHMPEKGTNDLLLFVWYIEGSVVCLISLNPLASCRGIYYFHIEEERTVQIGLHACAKTYSS